MEYSSYTHENSPWKNLSSLVSKASRDDVEVRESETIQEKFQDLRAASKKTNASSNNDINESLEDLTRECDYDTNPTELYKAIAVREFNYALSLLNRSHSGSTDVSEQANTWVVRRDKNGDLCWRMLPLHAAIIFRAPLELVQALIMAAPNSPKCGDDCGHLPLHLAFRYGTEENVMAELLKAYPGGVQRKDRMGKVPIECAPKETLNILETYSVMSAVSSNKAAVLEEENKVMNTISEKLVLKEKENLTAFEEIARLKENNAMIQAELNEKLALKEKEHAASLQEISRLKEKNGVIQALRNRLSISVSDMRKENTEALKKIVLFEEENKTLHAKIKELDEELTKKQKASITKEEELITKEDELKTKEDELKTKEDELKTKEEKIVALEDENESLQAENSKLNKELRSTKEDYELALEKVSSLNEKNEIVQILEEAIEELNDKLDTKEEEYDIAKDELDTIRQLNCSLRETLHQMTAKHIELANSSKHWKEKMNILEAKVEHLHNTNAFLEGVKHELKTRVEKQNDMLIKAEESLEKVTLTVKKQKEDITGYKAARQKMMQAFFTKEQQAEAAVEEDINYIQHFSYSVIDDVDRVLNKPYNPNSNNLDEKAGENMEIVELAFTHVDVVESRDDHDHHMNVPLETVEMKKRV